MKWCNKVNEAFFRSKSNLNTLEDSTTQNKANGRKNLQQLRFSLLLNLFRFGFFVSLLTLLGGCSPLKLVNGLTPNGAQEVERNLSYGVEVRQKLDVYRPAKPDEGSPVVVFFYGGSWRSGERGNYEFVGQSLSSRGFITVIPDYRLYPEVQFPAFVEDGARALAWIHENISEAEHGLVLIGHSAGAHLAALLALDQKYLNDFKLSSSQVKGLIGLAGPYAFDPLSYRKTRPIFSGLNDADNARPVSYACNNSPPLLLLHGREDRLVLPGNSRKLHELHQQCGMKSNFIELSDVGHFDIVLGLSDSFSNLAPVLEPIQNFIQESI